MAQLDYDEEIGALYGMYGSVEAELEVQRTIKRAGLTAFLCLLKRVIAPARVHVDNKGIIDGLRRGESKCIKPRAGDADLWIKIWEELHGLAESGILVGVGALVEYHPISAKDQSRLHQFGKKFLPGIFLGFALFALNMERREFGCGR